MFVLCLCCTAHCSAAQRPLQRPSMAILTRARFVSTPKNTAGQLPASAATDAASWRPWLARLEQHSTGHMPRAARQLGRMARKKKLHCPGGRKRKTSRQVDEGSPLLCSHAWAELQGATLLVQLRASEPQLESVREAPLLGGRGNELRLAPSSRRRFQPRVGGGQRKIAAPAAACTCPAREAASAIARALPSFVCVCEELEGKPKIGDPETHQLYNISVVPGETSLTARP
eukprot:scaffold11684_cov122-Isochrysis_galbana.AAC.4